MANFTTTGSNVYPAGHVIQIVEGTHSTEGTTTSTTFADTGIDVSITPTDADSKILVMAAVHGSVNGGSAHVGYYTIYRDSTNIGPAAGFASPWHGYPNSGGSNDDMTEHLNIQKLDSPNTTNATEYSVYAKTNSGSYITYWSMNASQSVIIAMEISG